MTQRQTPSMRKQQRQTGSTRGPESAESYQNNRSVAGFLVFAVLAPVMIAAFVVPVFALGIALGIVAVSLGRKVGGPIANAIESVGTVSSGLFSESLAPRI